MFLKHKDSSAAGSEREKIFRTITSLPSLAPISHWEHCHHFRDDQQDLGGHDLALKLEKCRSVASFFFSFSEKMHQILPLAPSLSFFKTMIGDLVLCALHQSFPAVWSRSLALSHSSKKEFSAE